VLKIVVKLWDRTPLGKQRSPDPLAGGEGLLPSPQELHHPRSRPSALRSCPLPPIKILDTSLRMEHADEHHRVIYRHAIQLQYLDSVSRDSEDNDVIQACAPQLSADDQHPVDRRRRVRHADHKVWVGAVPRPICRSHINQYARYWYGCRLRHRRNKLHIVLCKIWHTSQVCISVLLTAKPMLGRSRFFTRFFLLQNRFLAFVLPYIHRSE